MGSRRSPASLKCASVAAGEHAPANRNAGDTMETGKPLGFIGLGMLGSAIALRLRDLDRDLAVWNREPEAVADLVAKGAMSATGPAEVAAKAGTVMLCVLDDRAVEDVVLGPGGLLSTSRLPATVIDFSSTKPETARRVASELAARGSAFVDAPVSGGPPAAREGALTIMAGGDPAAFDAAAPLLHVLGRNVSHVGPVGAGQEAKILNQLLVGAGYVLMAEALAMARASSVDAGALPQVLAGGLADSRVLQVIYPLMHEDRFEQPFGRARQLNKDLATVAAHAKSLGLTLPLVEAAIGQYRTFTIDGNEMADSASVSRLYAPRNRDT